MTGDCDEFRRHNRVWAKSRLWYNQLQPAPLGFSTVRVRATRMPATLARLVFGYMKYFVTKDYSMIISHLSSVS